MHVNLTYENDKKVADFGAKWGSLTEGNATALKTGDGLVVIDVDVKDLTLIDPTLAAALGEPTVETARGYHYYYKVKDSTKYKTRANYSDHVDVRSDGGLVFDSYEGDSQHIMYKRVGKVERMPKSVKTWLIEKVSTNIIPQQTEYDGDAMSRRELKSYLKQLDCYNDRDDWLAVGMALHSWDSGERGLKLWDKWSSQADNYGSVEETWRSFSGNYDGARRTIGTLVYMVNGAPGNTLGGEELEPEDTALAVEVVEFVLSDVYKECIASAARLTEREMMADAITQIKQKFKVAVGDIRDDIAASMQVHQHQSFAYPDYEFNPQGELKYLATMNNLKKLFKNMGLKPYYDVILKDVIVRGSKWKGDNWQVVMRSEVLSEAVKTGLPGNITDRHYDPLMMSYEKNILLKEVKAVKWDGTDHVQKLADTIHVSGDNCYKEEGLRRWLTQCVAAWDAADRSPRKDKVAKYELILVLQSKQGVKKTSFFGKLLPGKLNKYFGDGVSLHTKDKDSVMDLLGYGIVELGELDSTFKKSDISDIKSFTSKRVDKIRPPYGRDLLTRPRRTSMCGSVNDAQFLNDATGARRFLVMAVTKFVGVDTVNMMQVWAQVWDEYKNGAKWWIENDEKWAVIRDTENEEHRESGLYGDMTMRLAEMLLTGHIIPHRISGSALFEVVSGRPPSQTEVINFTKELLARGAYRNKAKQFNDLLTWAEGYKVLLDL